MGHDSLEGLLGRMLAQAGLSSVQLFRGSEQRPSPAIFASVPVSRIDEVLGNDAAGHLQTGDICIEAAAHVGSREAAGGTQFAGNQTALFL